MKNIALKEILAKLPIDELQEEIEVFMEPMTTEIADKRLKGVAWQNVQNFLATETPFPHDLLTRR